MYSCTQYLHSVFYLCFYEESLVNLLFSKTMKNFFQNPYRELAGSSRNYTTPKYLLFLKVGSFLISFLLLAASFFPAWFFWSSSSLTGFHEKDIIAVIDVSESMGAIDGKKDSRATRLDTVKDFLTLIAQRNPENRFSIIIYEKESETFFPLSSDVPSFLSALGRLKPRMLSLHGSSISAVLLQAKVSLSRAQNPLILVFSDSGE